MLPSNEQIEDLSEFDDELADEALDREEMSGGCRCKYCNAGNA